MRLVVLCLGLCLVAACASPQQRCVNQALSELRRLDALIAETEANLARGYRLDRVIETRPTLAPCPPGDPFIFCPGEVVRERDRPVAIDPLAEARKLENLRTRRADAERRARAAHAACLSQHGSG